MREPFYKQSGIFIFGGLDDKNKVNNDLWLLQPDIQKNMKYLNADASFKNLKVPKLKFKLKKIRSHGQSPCPRYAHAACFIRDFLCIHGGRNDSVYSELGNIGFNDFHMYDINKNMWVSVCLFNTIASSRWGHSMCTVESSTQDDYQANSVVIFGGINLNSYQNTMFELVMDKERIN